MLPWASTERSSCWKHLWERGILLWPGVLDSQREAERGPGWGAHRAEPSLPLGGRVGGWTAVETVAMVQSKPSAPEQALAVALQGGCLPSRGESSERKKAKVPA